MRNHKQLTFSQRCQIQVLLERYFSHIKIADTINATQPVISREIRRNSIAGVYSAEDAQKMTEARCKSPKRGKADKSLLKLVKEKLRLRWSPEQMAGWLRKQSPLEAQEKWLSHAFIYQLIWQNKRTGEDLYTYLRRRGKKYQWRGNAGKTSRGQIKGRVSIDERPKEVEKREDVGHWEIDTVIGKSHSGALVTMVERKLRFTVTRRVIAKNADEVTFATLMLLKPYAKHVKSITADNGKEFSQHQVIVKALSCDFYFAHPYHSWERGTNENTNGLLKQYFPKSTDFKHVTRRQVENAVEELNHRPRKVLNYKTPANLFREYIATEVA